MTKVVSIGRGPAIRGVDPWSLSTGRMKQLFNDEERARLAAIASIVRFKKGTKIYHEGYPAIAVFNIISGVAKACRASADHGEHIS
jgi:CRP/FNR family transcriptional regulator